MVDATAGALWVKRVLGVEVAAPSGGVPSADLAAAVAAWQAALESVNQQIAALQSVLRASPDSDLHDIAEFGLNAMTGSHKVKIQAALIDITGGRATPKALQAAAKLTVSFLGHIASDPRIAACDANPFGVSLTLRNTLTPPLERLRAAFQAPA